MRLDELRHSKERPVTRYWKDGKPVPDGYQTMERNFYAPGLSVTGDQGQVQCHH